jgi:hypothetical protein
VAQVGEMTFPQLRCVLFKGREPVERLTDPASIKDWIRTVQDDV